MEQFEPGEDCIASFQEIPSKDGALVRCEFSAENGSASEMILKTRFFSREVFLIKHSGKRFVVRLRFYQPHGDRTLYVGDAEVCEIA
jgi:hypothetical protein